MAFLQVRIRLVGKTKASDDLLLLDCDEDWIRDRVLEPRDRGEPITVRGRTLAWEQIESIKISRTDRPAKEVAEEIRREREARTRASGVVAVSGISNSWRVVDRGEDLTDDLIVGAPGRGSPDSKKSGGGEAASDPRKRRKVMVVYGRDGQATEALFNWLRSIDLRPQEWTELVVATGSGTPYTGEILDKALEQVQAVVVLFTPDDLAKLRGDLVRADDGPEEREARGQPRPNVLFEAGLALGRHPTQTVIVEHGDLRGLSDLAGRHTVRLSRGVPALKDLAGRLQSAGCTVDLEGEAWLDAARFPEPPESEGGR
jgi:predicted nucleotide-binding protein